MAEIDFKAPLTLHQLQLWLAHQHIGRSALYNVTVSYQIPGGVQPEIFARAYTLLIREADCLRMQIREENGTPTQVIFKESSHALHINDFSQAPNARERYESWMKMLVETPVELDELVLNSALAIVDARTTYWVFTIHHILADAWGVHLLYRRLTDIVEAYKEGRDPGPSPLVSLRELAASDAAYRVSPEYRADEAYWAEKFSQMPDAPTLYGFSGRGKTAPSRRVTVEVETQPLRQFLEGEQVADFLGSTRYISLSNLFMTVLAAYLNRVSGSSWFTMDVALLNRPGAALRQVPAFTVQLAPLMIQLEAGETFRSLVSKIRREMREVAAHSRYPILNRNSQAETVSFNFHNRVVVPGGSPVETWWYAGVNSDDLSVNVMNPDLERGSFELSLDVSEEILQRVNPDQLCEHFLFVLRQCLENPDLPIGQVRLLTDEAAGRLIAEWNQTAGDFPAERGVHHLFEAWAARQPNAPAVYFEDQVLSYGELNAAANRLAHLLRQRGLQPGELVGVCLERSLDLMVTIFGVLKAGGVYVPLDPAYPRERLADIIHDAALNRVVTAGRFADGLPREGLNALEWEELRPLLQDSPAENEALPFSPNDLVYVIFTSGSTGHPKGVMIEHHSLVNFVTDLGQSWQVGPGDVCVQVSSLNFDFSIEEIFLPLTCGGAVVLRTQNFLDSIPVFLAECQRHQVTFLPTPTAFWHELVAQMDLLDLQLPASLRLLDVGGERMRPEMAAAWLERTGGKIRLLNGYGPTETTVGSTWYEVNGPAERWRRGEEVPIGRPGRNQRAYVLDSEMQPVPAGVIGELYIGGEGVARGYLHQPDLTAERFLADPFAAKVGARMYRTGDLTRQCSDGVLEFWGRADDQVKLGGYRIEPGEIETVLALHPRVSAALVAPRENHSADKRLVAYVIWKDDGEEVDLRAYLREKLPEYMIPSAFVSLSRFPLTPNGKLDRSALPNPFTEAPDELRQSAPMGSVLEAQLAAIWKEALGLSTVDTDQNFFDMGGNSLLGIRLFAEIEKKLKVRVPVAELFRSPTITQLAEAIQNSEVQPAWSPVVLIQPGSPGLPLFIVHGWGGGVLGYAALARELGTHWPIYGLQAAGMLGEQPPDETVEKMAARYVQAMKTIQPHGPYRLAGYCAGGVIAYEMACQLADQGEKTLLAGIIEGYSPTTQAKPVSLLNPRRWSAIIRNVPFWFREYRDIGLYGIRQRVIEAIRTLKQRHRRARNPQTKFLLDDVMLDEKGEVPDRQKELLRLHLDALSAYRPRPYPGKAIVFTARGLTILHSLFGSLDTTLGWQELALGGVVSHVVDGGHRDLHMPPNVSSLAAAMRGELELADETDSP